MEGREVDLAAGTTLFHGTLEEFDDAPRPGGDGVLWLAESPSIAQLYIPCSGGAAGFSPTLLTRPTKHDALRELQRDIGIEYDHDQVEWDDIGRPVRFMAPDGWDELPTVEYVVSALRGLGFDVESKYSSVLVNTYFDAHGGHRYLLPGQCRDGTLYVGHLLEPLLLWSFVNTGGGLNDPQYNWFDKFDVVRSMGFDGVLIEDFAQSEDWGNIGHLSVGLFGEALDAVEWERFPAQYEEWNRNDATDAYPVEVTPFLKEL